MLLRVGTGVENSSLLVAEILFFKTVLKLSLCSASDLKYLQLAALRRDRLK